MVETVKVKVLRHQTGDEAYEPGDTRELSLADAKRLEATGAVKIVTKAPEAKKAPELKNKKEPVPTNKAAPAAEGSK
jgi:hypothetical protein